MSAWAACLSGPRSSRRAGGGITCTPCRSTAGDGGSSGAGGGGLAGVLRRCCCCSCCRTGVPALVGGPPGTLVTPRPPPQPLLPLLPPVALGAEQVTAEASPLSWPSASQGSGVSRPADDGSSSRGASMQSGDPFAAHLLLLQQRAGGSGVHPSSRSQTAGVAAPSLLSGATGTLLLLPRAAATSSQLSAAVTSLLLRLPATSSWQSLVAYSRRAAAFCLCGNPRR